MFSSLCPANRALCMCSARGLCSAWVSDPAESADRRSPAILETFSRLGGSVRRPATARGGRLVTTVFVGLVAPLLPAAALGAPLPDASSEGAVAASPAAVWQRWEHVLTSARRYGNPYADVTLRVRYTGPGGRSLRAYGFWDGGDTFRIRCAFPIVGTWRWETECSDAADTGLHRQRGVVQVAAYQGDNPLYRRGFLKVSDNRRYLAFGDGTPFLWLGDTWWMGLTRRLRWPEEFQLLAADRVAKGFSVVQIVAGLYPDMPAYDPRGFNEAGHPWEAEYARLNPAYFDMADLRIQWLARVGLVPAVVGCWGYHLPWLGMERMRRHWRNLVARWGAYPVVWILAGEASMRQCARRSISPKKVTPTSDIPTSMATNNPNAMRVAARPGPSSCGHLSHIEPAMRWTNQARTAAASWLATSTSSSVATTQRSTRPSCTRSIWRRWY